MDLPRRLSISLVLLSLCPTVAQAAKHRLRAIRDDSVDLVMSVSWDFTKADAGEGDRDYLKAALREFSDKTYEATEGRLRICKVYVYNKRRNFDKADIIAGRLGRAHAELGGLRKDHGQMSVFREIETRPPGSPPHKYSAQSLGKTLAHEFGHYGLFVKDEYTEPQELVPTEAPYLRPRPCDATLLTLMGSPDSFAELSLPREYTKVAHQGWSLAPGAPAPADQRTKYLTCDQLRPPAKDAPETENALWRTAQWRLYQKSAWELVVDGVTPALLAREARGTLNVERFPSVVEGGVPTKLKYPVSNGDCFKAILMEGDFVVLAVDRSLSMKDKNASGQSYLALAVAAAKTYVNSAPAGTTIAVVEFAGEVKVLVQPTKIEVNNEAAARDKMNAALDAMLGQVPVGNTGLDAALTQARDLMLKNGEIGNSQYIVAISDGEVVTSPWILAQLAGYNMPIFTVAVADQGSSAMQEASRLTRGAHKNISGWQHGQVEEELRRDELLGVRLYPNPTDQAPLEAPTALSERDGSTAFRADWKEGDKALFELVAPDGSIITPGSLPPGVSYEPTGQGASYVVSKPLVGVYKPRIVPQSISTGDKHIWVTSESQLGLRVEVRGGEAYPNPWFVRAHLTAPQPVVGAAVKGKLKRAVPGAQAQEVAFRDDGEAPDEDANDGVYSAVIADVLDDGDLTLEVVAENPGGAKVDSSAVGDDPGGAETPTPLSAFTRDASVALEATGYFDMPQSPSGALHLRNDLTPVWVTINQPGDVVWLEFNGYKKGWYVAMTGGLIASDQAPMATRLTLYDTDGATELASDAQADGRARVDLHTPNADGKYYVKVEHAGGGVGRFQVAVAPGEWFVKSKGGQSAGGGSSGCGLARSHDAGGLLVFAAGIGSFVARRRRHQRR